MVDLDDPDWSFPQPDNLVQDGRALRFPDGRFGGPPRFVEPSGLSQRTHDCKFYQSIGIFFFLVWLTFPPRRRIKLLATLWLEHSA